MQANSSLASEKEVWALVRAWNTQYNPTWNRKAIISSWNEFLSFVIKGTWGLPGGHLEFGESFETCATRETLEETGLKIQDVQFLNATNSIMKTENKHYITIFMGGVCEKGVDPQVSWCWLFVLLRFYGNLLFSYILLHILVCLSTAAEQDRRLTYR